MNQDAHASRRDDRAERFTRVYEQHLGEVAAYIARRVPASDVDDLLAEAFLVAWRRLDTIPPSPLAHRAWLLGTARRVVANHHRARRRRASLQARMAAEPVVEWSGPSGGLDDAIVDAVKRLPERDRELLLLVAWEELTVTECARVLGCSAPAARLRLMRARRRLAKDLEVGRRGDRSLNDDPEKEAT